MFQFSMAVIEHWSFFQALMINLFKFCGSTKNVSLGCRAFFTENGVGYTRSITAHEQLMMFLTIVGHCDSNRRSIFEWRHSGETVSRHFHNVCAHLFSLAPRLIGPPDFVHTTSKIENNLNFFSYFRVRTWTKQINIICH